MMLRSEAVAIRPFEEDAARVVGNQVVFGDHVIAGLQQQADRREAAIAHETVATERQPVRIHQRRAGGAVLEDVVLEHVVVGEHVMEAVAQVGRAIAR